MEEEELQELIEQAKEDPEAFGRIYDMSFPRIFGYIAKRVPNMSDAEDVTGQVFEKVLKGIGTFNPSLASFDTWLYKIADNAVVDYYRIEGDRCLTRLEEARLMYDFGSNSSLDYVRKYLRILQLMKKLPASYQEVLSLRLLDDMNNQEIALLLGYSNRYVAVKISRALKQLKKLALDEGVIEEFP